MLRLATVVCQAAVIVLCVCAAHAADIVLKQEADGSVTVTTPIYTARIDNDGNLAELTVKGAPSFTHHFGNPDETPDPKPSVVIDEAVVTVRSGKMFMEWTFGEDTIAFVSEGYRFICMMDKSIKMLTAPGGGGDAIGKHFEATSSIVLANDLVISFDNGIHSHHDQLWPRIYTAEGKPAGSRYENTLRLGSVADAGQVLSGIVIQAEGDDDSSLRTGGNETALGLVHFPAPVPAAFSFTQTNHGGVPLEIEYRISAKDHYAAGREVFAETRKATLGAAESRKDNLEISGLEPGFYYLSISAWLVGKRLNETRQTFTVNLPSYKPALTRPNDFEEFWRARDAELAATPMNARLEKVSHPDNPDVCYHVKIDMPGNWTLECLYEVPSDLDPTKPAMIGDNWLSNFPKSIEAAGAADWKASSTWRTPFKVPHLMVGEPEDSTFTRWNSAADNNLLQSIMAYMRAVDFLNERPEVTPGRVMVNGSSRGGPLAFVTLACRADKLCGGWSMVPTSAGLSWTDRPYQGWGMPNGHDPKNPGKVAALAAMAVYVDPVNHAPDVRLPFVACWGATDDLSPPQGIEAMYVWSPAEWKCITRHGSGHLAGNPFGPQTNALHAHINGEVSVGK